MKSPSNVIVLPSLGAIRAAFKGEAVVLPFPPQEELTPEGLQLVIPGCTREDPPVKKQMELW